MRWAAFLVCMLAYTNSAFAGDPEQAARDSILRQTSQLLSSEQFDVLNKLSASYRESGEKTPSGIWKLSEFYLGLETPVPNGLATEDQWQAAFVHAKNWIAKAPSPAAYIALANLHIGYAWAVRGDGIAASVRQHAWPVFQSHLNMAKKILTENKSRAKADPAWYEKMERIAVEEQDMTAAFAFFQESVGQFKYYNDNYYAIMRGLEPMWRGSYVAMESFADRAASSTKDKLGDEMYTRLYWHIARCSCGFPQDPLVKWSRIKAGFDDIVKRYPTQWNLSAYANYACLAQDKVTTKSVIQRLTQPIMSQWEDDPDFYRRCRAWATAS